MATMTNYFFLRHIKECKRKLKDFDKPKTLRNELKKIFDGYLKQQFELKRKIIQKYQNRLKV